MKTDLFQSCGYCWVFQICWHIECSIFTESSSRIWNRSTGIPSPPIALLVVMLPKGHLTSHSRMSGSRWVITPLWLSSHTLAKKCSKFSKPGFNNTWTVNFQMFKLGLEKAEEQEIKFPTSAGSWKKPESSRKTFISALLTMPKPLTVWITINCRKFWKRWEYQTTWPASWETYMQVRKQQLELDMEQLTASK